MLLKRHFRDWPAGGWWHNGEIQQRLAISFRTLHRAATLQNTSQQQPQCHQLLTTLGFLPERAGRLIGTTRPSVQPCQLCVPESSMRPQGKFPTVDQADIKAQYAISFFFSFNSIIVGYQWCTHVAINIAASTNDSVKPVSSCHGAQWLTL